tara:strand:+ start:66 stop:530 length:465 start_codon:yes stop_codon:yes gene_type:complete
MDLGNLYRFFSDNIDFFAGIPFVLGFVIVGAVFAEDFENLFLIEKREKSVKEEGALSEFGPTGLMVIVTLLWAFSVVVINKHFEIIGITENLTSNMLWSFCFTMLLYSVVLALIPYLISFFLRKTLIQIRLFLVLISIWYLIFIIPQFSKAGLL